MKAHQHRLVNWVVITAIWSVTLLDVQAAQPELGAESFHPTRILARFKAGEKVGPQHPVLRPHGLGVQHQFKVLPQVVVLDLADPGQARAAAALPPPARARGLRDRIAALQASGRFDYVEPDYIRTLNAEPDDSAFADGTLWALKNVGQGNGVAGADIGTVGAWNLTTGSTNVIVAVVDAGIRYTHQDLTANMWRNPGESGDGKETNGLDDDGDGYADNVFGINAVSDSGDPNDDHGHGSHVSGTIGAAANNGGPHVGVAWNVRLMACKAFNAQGGNASQQAYVSDTTECIAFAVAKGARIINASYGGPAYSQTEFDAIRAARDQGVLFVAAAGNDGQDNDTSWLRSYPASYALENIVAVAAVDRSDNLAGFSNAGRKTVHLGAPGKEIFSCWNGSDTDYAFLQGTSMAAPHVAGAAALVLAHHTNASLVELRRRLLAGAVPILSLTNRTATGGRLNVFNALVATPTSNLNVEVFPRDGQYLVAGKPVSLSAIVSDLRPVTNATVLARISGFTNLLLFDNGVSPDGVARDGIYAASFLTPTHLSSLTVAWEVSAPGWASVTSQVIYPVVLPPPNDDFAHRSTIPPNVCFVSVTGTNGSASREPGEPYHGTGFGGRSLWWTWTAPFSGPVKFTTAESVALTALAIYTGSAVSNLTLLASNDHPGPNDYYSALTFDAVTGREYQIAVDGIGPDAGQISMSVIPLIPSTTLANALDDPLIAWSTSSNAPWFGQNCTTHDGVDGARSAAIEAYGESWLETAVRGPGWFSFWWKVSSEASYDSLRFHLDGVPQPAITGQVDWQQHRRWLEAGNHTLRWSYNKDVNVSIGQDAGWVDEISLERATSAMPTLFGDLNDDGWPTVLDLTLLTSYLGNTNTLRPQVAVFADVDTNGVINGTDVTALADAILGRSILHAPVDTDGDGLPDVLEPLLGLNPSLTNSPGSEFPDGDRDFDGDGLSNARELQLGTDPLRRDTDGDGWADEAELTVGSSPLDANSKPSLTVVSAPRVALVLPANQGSGGFINNTVIAAPRVSLVLPANQGTAGLSNNTVVAAPPLALLLPANQGGTGVTNHTVIAAPTIALLLPADQGANGLTNNTVVARPPVALVLPANQSGGVTNNTVIAMPPVRLELRLP